MKDRRTFIKTGVAALVGISAASPLLANVSKSEKEINLPGLIYNEKHPGKWKLKVDSHLPKISINGSQISITTDHGMSEIHYIVRHTLVDKNGNVIGSKTFYPTDEPKSSFDIPQGYKGKLFATSFCNKHDFWVKEFAV